MASQCIFWQIDYYDWSIFDQELSSNRCLKNFSVVVVVTVVVVVVVIQVQWFLKYC